jgi:hypothetical protein
VPPAVVERATDWVGHLGVVLLASTRPVPTGNPDAGRLKLLYPGGLVPA